MQIDPAALSRADAASTAIASSKGSAANTPATQKSTKALISVPRLDLEPAYTELKAAIGDNWAEYKQSTALFLLGMELQVMGLGLARKKKKPWLTYPTFYLQLLQGTSTKVNTRRVSII